MTQPIDYRRATANDILILCELGQILNASHHAVHPAFFAPATADVARDQAHWLPSLEEKNRATFLAEQDGVAVGFITLQVTQPTSTLLQPSTIARIGSIGVVERCRGQGVGRALLGLAEHWAREQGAIDIRLNVWSFNEGAIALYQEFGYEIYALEMGKPVNPCDAGIPKTT